MGRKETIKIGDVFNRLTVLEKQPKKTYAKTKYLCQCSCGKKKIVYGSSLKTGDTQSCGCYNSESSSQRHRHKIGESSYNYCEAQYKAGAKQRNITYSLTREEFRTLIVQDCYWCGDSPRRWNRYFTEGVRNKFKDTVSEELANLQTVYVNGIDRVDSDISIGYTISNCVPCCTTCNKMKNNYDKDHFLSHIKKILKKQGLI